MAQIKRSRSGLRCSKEFIYDFSHENVLVSFLQMEFCSLAIPYLFRKIFVFIQTDWLSIQEKSHPYTRVIRCVQTSVIISFSQLVLFQNLLRIHYFLRFIQLVQTIQQCKLKMKEVKFLGQWRGLYLISDKNLHFPVSEQCYRENTHCTQLLYCLVCVLY